MNADLELRVRTPTLVFVEDESIVRRLYEAKLKKFNYRKTPVPFLLHPHADDFLAWLTNQEEPENNLYFFDNTMADSRGHKKDYALILLHHARLRGVPLAQTSIISALPPASIHPDVAVLEKPFGITEFYNHLRQQLDAYHANR